MSAKHLESRMLPAGDIELHLLTCGDPDGIPVVFLPGITSLAESFADVLERMPDEYHCVSVDMRGRGRSTWVKAGYRISDYVQDVLAVVNALIANPKAPVLVGHSMGGRIAAAFAAQYSRLLSGIVVVDPPIHGPGHREAYPTPLDTFLYQKRLADAGQREEFRAQFPGLPDRLIELREREYRNVCVEAIVESYRAFFTESFHVHLKLLDCPVLLMAAEWGDTIRDEELALLARLNPSIETVRVPGVGHMIYKDDPDGFTRRVAEFVARFL